jgi:hypothetical protein
MGIDGCDNKDPDKTHPAIIKDPVKREQIDQYTQTILKNLVCTDVPPVLSFY